MARVAVFVDAGYLFAQGSTSLMGQKQPRSSLELNDAAVIAELVDVARSRCADSLLLRIYWYDGSSYKGPTAEHQRLASSDNVKVRLGFLNSQGQQKGVDSLIVTDLVELGRNGAICDAVLLSGDEDVRIGVQLAQSFGVRVHLIGIAPSRGSQSQQLIQEADTTVEWSAETVRKFLSHRAPIATSAISATKPIQQAPTTQVSAASLTSDLDEVAKALAAEMSSTDLTGFAAFIGVQRGVPPEFDGRLLARARAAHGADLDGPTKRAIRKVFLTYMRDRI